MPAGRPPFFDNVEELENKINEYFNNCPHKRQIILRDSDGNQDMIEVPSPTISGLAYHLGFASRQSCYDYEVKPEFAYTLKRAKLFMENEYEQMLKNGQCTGAIFALKNLGWKDKHEVENTNTNTNIEVTDQNVIDKVVNKIKEL